MDKLNTHLLNQSEVDTKDDKNGYSSVSELTLDASFLTYRTEVACRPVCSHFDIPYKSISFDPEEMKANIGEKKSYMEKRVFKILKKN